MTKENNTYFIIQKCQRIEGNSICTRENLMNYTMDTCYSMLLKGLPGNCTFEYYKDADKIKPITNNHVIVLSKFKTHLNSTCGISNRNITGKLLIEFHNCSIMLNGTIFTRMEFIHPEKPFGLPLHGLNISEMKMEKPTTIENSQIENRRHLTALTQSHKQHAIATFGISTCSFILGLIIIIY